MVGPDLEGQGQVRKKYPGPGLDRTSDSLPPLPCHHYHQCIPMATNDHQSVVTVTVALGREGEGRGRWLVSFGHMGIFLVFIDCTYIHMSTCINTSNNFFWHLNTRKLHSEIDIFTLFKIKNQQLSVKFSSLENCRKLKLKITTFRGCESLIYRHNLQPLHNLKWCFIPLFATVIIYI